MHIDVPEDEHAVFSNDGRVFYDLAHLISEYEPRIARREIGARVTGETADLAYVHAERAMLEAIRQSMEILTIEESM